MPRGFYGRAALILIVPIVTIQLVMSIVFIQRHFEGVTRQMTESIVAELSYILPRIDAAPDLDTALRDLRPLSDALQIGLRPATPDAPPPARDRRLFYDLSGRAVIDTLRAALPQYRVADLLNPEDLVLFWIDTSHGLVEATLPRRRVSASNPHQLLVIMVFSGLVLTLISAIFLRNQVRSVKRLAAAAEAFGRGQNMPYRPTGATEIRAAGRAFLDMRARIERQIEQRTLMLSGISHDLRTPLTRLSLSLSLADENDETRAMQADLAEMARLIDSFLDYVRGQATAESAQVDVVALLEGLILNARRCGGDVRLIEAPGTAIATLRVSLIERAIDNLISNALRYAGRAEIQLKCSDTRLVICVEDDGPGIPDDRREEAKRPFVRLDPARNQDRGSGVGLGLAIADDAAQMHGGRLILSRSARLGGLCACIDLPRGTEAAGGRPQSTGLKLTALKIPRRQSTRRKSPRTKTTAPKPPEPRSPGPKSPGPAN
ncbi:ATP-binding protein [Roseicitreum antarcticum]|uniref:histidine kinase n=1 Tax=Roseicitreum antarcticum TaxID=564137 RepID=A0A1H2Y168_9RHOB|nr:ATP-binding protein [Roseicitreum antarcticum]SDW98548.1 two-component system, OmpR family, osmolarity sensor histidine kinase EnvZ [Roseicitreum antarcticum]